MRDHSETLAPDEGAVSELTSLLTLLAVAGIVVAAVGMNVLFVEANNTNAPDASFNFDYVQEQQTLIVTHRTGDPIRADNLLIRGEDSEVFWHEANQRINGSTLVGPRNTTQISNGNAYGERVRANDRIDIVYQNATANTTVILDQWNGSSGV